MRDAYHFEPPGRLAQFMRMVADFDRHEIEAAVDGLIAVLDTRDGDPDLEPEADRCLAADDGCESVVICGKRYWGSGVEDVEAKPLSFAAIAFARRQRARRRNLAS